MRDLNGAWQEGGEGMQLLGDGYSSFSDDEEEQAAQHNAAVEVR